MSEPPHGIDVVGDLHGQLGALGALGRTLGYDVDGEWTHPEGRKLIFIGDLIDRGPASLEVAQRVHTLWSRGDAVCLMGNHELNLVEWRHGRAAPKHSNVPTLEDVERRPEVWQPLLDFFETLPLAIETDTLRITHAVWNRGCVRTLEPALRAPDPSHPPHPDWVEPWVRLHSPYRHGEFREGVPREPFVDETCGPQKEPALEILLKGHEMDSPEPFTDNDGRSRHRIRAEWWREGHPEVPQDRRIVFGHYWNMPPLPGRHEGFVSPHPSGHPKLRAWFDAHHAAVPRTGSVSVPAAVRAVCIDYNGVVRARGGRPCAGAYRHPEGEVVWAVAD
ncbi:MAG: metallophosphoesterase [Myxococcota bacterium]